MAPATTRATCRLLEVASLLLLLLLFAGIAQAGTAPATNLFGLGIEAYRAGDYATAAESFQGCVTAQPSSGALQNLGNAQWLRGLRGEAILAWERALWLDPFDRHARNNLSFARAAALLEVPNLAWHESASAWLPSAWWAWATAASLWLAVAMMTLPGALRWRKAAWQQAVAALSLGVFLLTLPAHFGAISRSHIGIVLTKDAALRLTPTAEGEPVVRLTAGEPAREVRSRGRFVFVRTSRGVGWIEQSQFALICPR